MVRLRIGDTISCRICASVIVSPYHQYDSIKTFVVIASNDSDYYLYVPHYYCLQGSGKIDANRCKKIGIAQRYWDEEIVCIRDNMVLSISRKDGMNCSMCNEFYFYAEGNQKNGSLICYSCRQTHIPE